MGSILRQKLATVPPVADETRGLIPLWDGFGRLVARRLEEQGIGSVIVENMETNRVVFESYRARHDGPEAIFVMGSEDAPVSCIAHFTRDLAGLIVNKKLGDSGDGGPDYEPGTLDLMLLRPVVTEIFTGMQQSCSGLDKHSPFRGASYQGGMTRVAAVAVEDQRQTMLELIFHLAISTERNTTIRFLIPYHPVERLASLLSSSPRQEQDDPDDPWAPHMRNSVLGSRVRLMAIIESFPMTVAECSRLELGQVLPLPGSSLNELSIAVKTEHGNLTMATGALGVMKQFKAVKLMSDPPEEFAEDFVSGF